MVGAFNQKKALVIVQLHRLIDLRYYYLHLRSAAPRPRDHPRLQLRRAAGDAAGAAAHHLAARAVRGAARAEEAEEQLARLQPLP